MPPGPPILSKIGQCDRTLHRKRCNTRRCRNGRSGSAHSDELEHILASVKGARNADVVTNQRCAGQCFEGVACGDQPRGGHRRLNREIDRSRAEPDSGPCPIALQENSGKRQAGRGPYGRRITRRNRERQRKLGQDEIKRRQKNYLARVYQWLRGDCLLPHGVSPSSATVRATGWNYSAANVCRFDAFAEEWSCVPNSMARSRNLSRLSVRSS